MQYTLRYIDGLRRLVRTENTESWEVSYSGERGGPAWSAEVVLALGPGDATLTVKFAGDVSPGVRKDCVADLFALLPSSDRYVTVFSYHTDSHDVQEYSPQDVFTLRGY